MSSNNLEKQAAHCLLHNTTYRLTSPEAADPLVGFRILWRTLKRIYRSEPQGIHRLEDGDRRCAIFNSETRNYEPVIAYYRKMLDPQPGWYLTKEELPAILSFRKTWLPLLRFGLARSLTCLISGKNRGNRALDIHIVTEIAALLEFCKKEHIDSLIDHAPYLIDSNWQYLQLRELGVFVTKVPSPGPLRAHHSVLQADRLITTSGYQEEELEQNELRVSVSERESWIPEASLNYIFDYYPSAPDPKAGVLGFYSHAGWLRKDSGHTDDGLYIPETEVYILRELRDYLSGDTDMRLLIFPHPRERSPDVWPRTLAFYREQLGQNIQWDFFREGVSSVRSFHEADIGLAAYSTIIYERLFCGFKVLIGNALTPEFPFTGSQLNQLCFNQSLALSTQIEKISGLSNTAFFQEMELHAYHHLAQQHILDRVLRQTQNDTPLASHHHDEK